MVMKELQVKLKELSAVIQVAQYQDVRPTIVCDDIQDGLKYLSDLARSVGNNTFADKLSGEQPKATGNVVKLNQGQNTILFYPDTHTYTDEAGNKYRSGSEIANSIFRPFNAEAIAKGDADKIAGWEAKGDDSAAWGSLIHSVCETFVRYGVLPNEPYLADMVNSFVEVAGKDYIPEQFVCCPDMKICGRVDGLVPVDKTNKVVSILDIKSGDIYKKKSLTPEARAVFPKLKGEALSGYSVQLNAYRLAYECLGYKVKDMIIYNWTHDSWVEVKIDKLNISSIL